MTIKIEMLLLNTPLLIILILLIILLLFCFMKHYFYKSQSLNYDESDLKYKTINTKHTKNFNDKITKIHDLKNMEIKKHIIILKKIIKEIRISLQEKFEDIGVEDLQANLDTLYLLDSNLTDFETTDLLTIEKTMDLVKSQRLENKKKILDLLTNIYLLASIDNVNKSNAVSYREYLKYVSPKDNIYYKQYL
jgi:hypothetical protein